MTDRDASLRRKATAITFTLNGQTVQADAGDTLIEVADRLGIEIPRLCHKPGYRPDGNCRSCMVEIDGERVLAPSCCRHPAEGMVVRSDSERARAAQRGVLELLLSDMPEQAYRADSELAHWVHRLTELGGRPLSARYPAREQPPGDDSHPAIVVNLDACIQCTRCVRACREEQANDVIGYAWRGDAARIVFDSDDPMGQSSCVACGECVQACPTGALMPRDPATGRIAALQDSTAVDSLCPYCGVGCQLRFRVHDDRIVAVEGRDGPANAGRLCVKGRFGFDYVRHPERLTVPLIRRPDAPKRMLQGRVPANWRDDFREAGWDEAIAVAAAGLTRIRDTHGPRALAGFGSAKGSNEEAYLFQKLVRTGFGSNNVDHCTRLCHASSVAALLEGLGSGAVSNPVRDVAHAEVAIVIGANPTSNHPVAATFIKNAARQGTCLIVADPRRTDLARHAEHVLTFRPGSDVAMLNALLNVIVTEDLIDRKFVADRTEAVQAVIDEVRATTPEAMAPICGIDAQTLRTVARRYATSRASIIFWGMGVSQHTHGTDNVRCLIAMAMLTGQIGRPGTGLHPLRGQNNVQGASDAGLIPMVFPDYRSVADDTARALFEQQWGVRLDPEPGLTVTEILSAAIERRIRGMLIMGENPAMSDPDLNHARQALIALDHLVVQDIFPTETAILADVILPASAFAEKTGSFTNTDRMVQLGRQAVNPPGQARHDLWILNALARAMGLDWRYDDPAVVFDEMRLLMPSIRGIDWARLLASGSITYPCTSADDPGQPIVFGEQFPTASGRARLVPAHFAPADELPDDDYPFVLITGRQLEHWHTGSMTRRARVLDATEPEPTIAMHPGDLARLGAGAGDRLQVSSRRGSISLRARSDPGMRPGSVFIPFAYAEAAANMLTNPAIDPVGKIPEFKFCAVRVFRDTSADAPQAAP
ncbi:MAG: formate dehydrogenase subunit alpha [Burkholderiaceae bacterium]